MADGTGGGSGVRSDGLFCKSFALGLPLGKLYLHAAIDQILPIAILHHKRKKLGMVTHLLGSRYRKVQIRSTFCHTTPL